MNLSIFRSIFGLLLAYSCSTMAFSSPRTIQDAEDLGHRLADFLDTVRLDVQDRTWSRLPNLREGEWRNLEAKYSKQLDAFSAEFLALGRDALSAEFRFMEPEFTNAHRKMISTMLIVAPIAGVIAMGVQGYLVWNDAEETQHLTFMDAIALTVASGVQKAIIWSFNASAFYVVVRGSLLNLRTYQNARRDIKKARIEKQATKHDLFKKIIAVLAARGYHQPDLLNVFALADGYFKKVYDDHCNFLMSGNDDDDDF